MRFISLSSAACFAFLLLVCGAGGTQSVSGERFLSLGFEPIGGAFDLPLFLTSPPGDPRLFVVEQRGTIRIVENGQQLPAAFLDVSALLLCCGEQGLIGMAFDPDYASSGRFYVHYTDQVGDRVLARYRVRSRNPDLANPASAEILLTISRIVGHHNGGMLAFGPDGYLYMSSGDGGAQAEGQTLDDLQGAILRLDVSGASGYAIPADNPFAAGGGEPEIWSYGLRNPWRMSFDRQTGDLYVADVGLYDREEINVATLSRGLGRGVNYGWNILEGTLCNDPQAGCSSSGTVLPVHEYDHAQGCSVIGGYVYRGAAIPALRGTYFYGDYCEGSVRSFRYAGAQVTDHRSWSAYPGGAVTSFGEDADGEIYVLTRATGIYRIVER